MKNKVGRPIVNPLSDGLMELEAKALEWLENETFPMEARKAFAKVSEMAWTLQSLVSGNAENPEVFEELLEKLLGGGYEA